MICSVLSCHPTHLQRRPGGCARAAPSGAAGPGGWRHPCQRSSSGVCERGGCPRGAYLTLLAGRRQPVIRWWVSCVDGNQAAGQCIPPEPMPCAPSPIRLPTHLCSPLQPSPPTADECLLLGTSEGFLQLHSASSGALLLRQRLHHSPAVSAAVRWSGAGSDPDDLSEDVTLTFADAVVRLPAWEVWAAARWAAGRGGGNGSSGGHWWSSGGGASSAAASSTSSRQLVHFSKFTLPKGAGGWADGWVL